jgi:hypothetical protein
MANEKKLGVQVDQSQIDQLVKQLASFKEREEQIHKTLWSEASARQDRITLEDQAKLLQVHWDLGWPRLRLADIQDALTTLPLLQKYHPKYNFPDDDDVLTRLAKQSISMAADLGISSDAVLPATISYVRRQLKEVRKNLDRAERTIVAVTTIE